MTQESLQAQVLYQRYLEHPEEYRVAEQFWGVIPSSMTEAVRLAEKIKPTYSINDFEAVIKVIKNTMKTLGIYTSKVENNLNKIKDGIVETGQQPNCLGGPSLILNKIIYVETLAGLCKSSPVYFIGDYDSVQPELINMRVPSPSLRGMLVSYPVEQEYLNAPIRHLPNPSDEWLDKTLEKFESNYRGLLKGVDPVKQEKILQNLYHVYTIIRSCFYSTTNVADWSTKILGTLINLEGELGVPFFMPSSPEMRRLLQPGYELLLSEPNRSRFIEAANNAVEVLESYGYRAQIGVRGRDYVPFFYECKTESCQGGRVELKYSLDNPGSMMGKCPKCEEAYSFSFNSSNPDLSEIIEDISPRVDSRQVIVDSILPVIAHVGGPGETSYYAEVFPGLKTLNLPSPVFMRYTRVFYNTPWNDAYARKLIEKGYRTLINEELFKVLAGWVEAKKSVEFNNVALNHNSLKTVIEGTYKELLDNLTVLENDVTSIKQKLNDPSIRQGLLAEMKKKQAEIQEIESYLSSAFGHFAPEKYGQEVNWLWIDLALASGVNDLVKIYKRLYGPLTPNASTFFVNL